MENCKTKNDSVTRAALPRKVEEFVRQCCNELRPRSYLIPILHQLQEEEGYLREDQMATVASLLGVTLSEVMGVATFYHYFTLKPKGKHTISICLGTACHVKGAGKIVKKLVDLIGIKEGETSKDDLFSIESARCVGMCALAPVMIIDERVYGNVQPDELEEILGEYGFKGGR
ncbi:MAG: NADH-quinone oxidoreductase subunit NuoE [Chitinivibrionales bacterium]|nr:NADH-quinone oxidoreductase subunit NuoE [Chitinivibrionales bacterium]